MGVLATLLLTRVRGSRTPRLLTVTVVALLAGSARVVVSELRARGQADAWKVFCADLVCDLRIVCVVLGACSGSGLAILDSVALIQFQRGICIHL